MLRLCSTAVFRCFKWFERTADRITGAVGPFFVGLAWILMGAGIFFFFTVVAPSLPWPLLSGPFCLLSATNMLAHYYWACTIAPGTPIDGKGTGEEIGWTWASRRSPATSTRSGVSWSRDPDLNNDWVVVANRHRPSKCKRCFNPKPERTHHCRVCKQCILKYDHHCPWINQCVGLRNERHFVLFMAWFVNSTMFFVFFGYDFVWKALDFTPGQWTSPFPQTGFVLIYILSLALGVAVAVMLTWHLYLICRGESTVENSDHYRYEHISRGRGTKFENSYDLGRKQNLAVFFNVVPTGYPMYTLLLPFRCAPFSDGQSWPRKPGLTSHAGIEDGDEMTDIEDEEV